MMADSVAMAAGTVLAEAARPPAFVTIIGTFYRVFSGDAKLSRH